MKKWLLSIFAFLMCFVVNANHWESNPYLYENNMISIGIIKIDGVEQRSDSLEIGAFCDDECRGSAIATYSGSFDRFFVYLMIYGNQNDEINFRLYDHLQDMEPNVESLSTAVFQINGQLGSSSAPFEFCFETLAPPTYVVTVTVDPENSGTATGSGVYNAGDMCTIEMTPNVGYAYLNLTESGNIVTTDNRYSFQVFGNQSFVANFELNQYEVTAAVNPENSAAVSGGGTYNYGETCSVSVAPFEHWHFQDWTLNGETVSTNTEYSFTVTDNVTLTANLYYYDAVEENQDEDLKIYPNPVKDVIFVELGEKHGDIVITNSIGQVVKTINNQSGLLKINVSDLIPGVYFVTINNNVTKMIKN